MHPHLGALLVADHGSGFVGSVLVAFLAVGLLIVLARWVSSKPRSRRRR